MALISLREKTSLVVYTLGHSNRPIEEFIGLLKGNHISLVMDVRTIPRSRHNPQYGADEFARSLRAAHVGYRHMPGLGGLRKPRKDSLNTGWRNESFRGYADYMQTREFRESLIELIATAATRKIVIVCAEAVPWRCHRNLIADALTARGIRVEHILNLTRNQPHRLAAWAKAQGDTITYPGEERKSA